MPLFGSPDDYFGKSSSSPASSPSVGGSSPSSFVGPKEPELFGGVDDYFGGPPQPPKPSLLSRVGSFLGDAYSAIEAAPGVAGYYYAGGPQREAALNPATPEATFEPAAIREMVTRPEMPPETYPEAIARGVGGELLTMAGSPTNAALMGAMGALPGGMARLASAGFAAHMAPGAADAAARTYQSFLEQGMTPEVAQQATEAALAVGMTTMAGLHAAKPRGVAAPVEEEVRVAAPEVQAQPAPALWEGAPPPEFAPEQLLQQVRGEREVLGDVMADQGIPEVWNRTEGKPDVWQGEVPPEFQPQPVEAAPVAEAPPVWEQAPPPTAPSMVERSPQEILVDQLRAAGAPDVYEPPLETTPAIDQLGQTLEAQMAGAESTAPRLGEKKVPLEGQGTNFTLDEKAQAVADAERGVAPGIKVSEAEAPLGDRRAEVRGEERRVDTTERRRVAEMSPEEMRAALHTDDLTGLGNRRAYEETERQPSQAMLDVEGLKWANDNLGHGAGDGILKAVGDAIKEEGVQGFRLSGDEFIVEAARPEEARAIVERINDRLSKGTIVATLPDGTVREYRGPRVHSGLGGTLDEAAAALNESKRTAVAAGERAARGERPSGLAEVPAAGDQARVEAPAEARPAEPVAAAPVEPVAAAATTAPEVRAGEQPPGRPAEEVEPALSSAPLDLESTFSKIDADRPGYSWLDQEADAALDRLKKTSESGMVNMGADPAIAKDMTLVGARWIRDGIRSVADFTTRLAKEFGQGVARVAQQVWDSAMGLLGRGRAPEEGVSTAPLPKGTAAPRPAGALGEEGISPPPKSGPPARGPIKPIPDKAGQRPVPAAPKEEAAAAGAAFKEGPPVEGKPSGSPDFDINVARTSPEVWVQQAVGRLVGAAPSFFGREEGGARGPKRSWDEVRVEAVKRGFTDDEIKRAFKNKGGMLSDVEMEGAKIAGDELTKRAKGRYEESKRLREEGQTGAAEDQEALYQGDISRLMGLHYALIGSKSEAARALALARKLGEGLDPMEKAFQSWLRSNKALGPEIQGQFYEAMQKGDAAKLQALRRQVTRSGFWDKVVEGWKAGLLSGIPTQVVNFGSNAVKINVLEPAEQAVMGMMDFLRGVPDAERRAFTGEALASWKGARAGLDYALHGAEDRGYAGLFPALKEIFKLQYEEGEIRRALQKNALGEEGSEFESQGGAISGKKGEVIRIPYHLLNAADAFWKAIAGNQELYRQAYREGRQKSLKGPELESHIRDYATKYADGSLPNLTEIQSRIKNAQLTGTYQEKAGPFVRSVMQMSQAHPFIDFVLPFKKTPANIAKATLRRTPFGLIDAVVKNNQGKLTPEAFNERIAQGIVGTTIGVAAYWLAKEGGLQFTGGGPADPRKRQSLIDTGWQPYSLKIGDRYVSYQRIEPVSSLIGMAADARELEDAKKTSEKIEKMGALIGENLTNKTFLAGLEGFTSALSDPVQFGAAFLKQLEGSAVPAIVGKAAQAIDPKVRDTQALETLWGIPEPIAAKLPGISTYLPARKTPTGEDRTRKTSALERFISPVPSTVEEKGPLADLQRVFNEIDFIPDQPKRYLQLSGGKRIDLEDAEYEILQEANQEASKRAAKLVGSYSFKRMDPDEKENELRKIYATARRVSRYKLYQDPAFRRRAAKIQRG